MNQQKEASGWEVTKTELPKVVEYLSQIYNFFDYNPKQNFKNK